MYLVSVLLACLAVTAAPAGVLSLDGPMEQGGMVIGRVTPGSEVSLDGTRVNVSPAGVFVIGFDRDAAPAARLDVAYPDGGVEHRTLRVEQRKYPTERINGLPSAEVTPGPKALKRIRRESEMIASARTTDGSRTDFTAGFIRPVPGRVSGVFGSQRILNGKPRRPHYGVDFAAPKGTPVKAPAPGVITLVDKDMYFTGGTVILDHGHGISSVFIHLSRIDVSVGQQVARGEVIGAVGATGRATGPHLHWGVNWFKTRLDPELLLH
ncbi:MAG: M23 family metallopeptidase [Arenicellales bacterium]|jgi:murein DD-endopeptidase MepM/ murein hydrolase activator NlpD